MFEVDPALLQQYRDSVDLSNFPKRFLQRYQAADKEAQDKWFLERFLCLKYHLYLSGFAIAEKTGDPDLPEEHVPIMGMDFQPNPHELLFKQFLQKRPGENTVFADLDTVTKKRMILWPRGLFKTSAVVVDIVQTILNYPNIRICFLTGGKDLARAQLLRIKQVFEHPTPRFRWLFPEFCLKSVLIKKNADVDSLDSWLDVPAKLGNAHEFTVPCRNSAVFAQPTFMISTAKSVKAGAHFDIIYIDDLVNEQNYRSIKLLEKSYQDYIDICPLLDPKGYIVMTGTRYSFGDTYERIQKKAEEEIKKLGYSIWNFSIRDCWSMGCQNCEHTDVYHNYDVNILQPPCSVLGCRCLGFKANGSKGVLFPEARTNDGRPIGHTLEFLEREKFNLGLEFFANQYENRPIAKESQTFTETLIGAQTLHDLNQLPTYLESYTFVVGDLAYVGQANRDYSVLFVCRKYRGQLFIFDCFAGNWGATDIAKNTVAVLLKHRPAIMYYEKYNGWDSYDKNITAEAQAQGIEKVPIQWEKGSQTPNAKLARIGAVQGVLSGRRLWLYGGMPFYQKLVEQLVKWPKLGRHDDFADCAGQVVAAPTGYQLEIPPAPPTVNNWLRRLNAAEPQDDSYNDHGCGTGIVC